MRSSFYTECLAAERMAAERRVVVETTCSGTAPRRKSRRDRGVCFWARRFVASALLIGVAVSAVTGCNDKDRRLSEMEALSYKRQLVQRQEISYSLADRLGNFPGRTEREIDAYYKSLQREQDEITAAERRAIDLEVRERLRGGEE